MIGIAVIGVANGFEAHAKSLVDLKDRARVVWAAARSAARLSAAERFGFPVTTDITAAIGDPAVQAVLIVTPANSHLPIAEAAFAAGKHVLCEKPIEASLQRGEQLVAAAQRSGCKLGVVLQMRFRAGSRRLKALLDEGALGEVQAASMTAAWWRPQSYYDVPGRGSRERDGGGVLITQAIHTLDLLRWLVGVQSVSAAQIRTTALHDIEAEDYAAALIRLGNGAPGTLMATTAAYPGSPENIQIIGTLGTASLQGGSLQVGWLDGREETLVNQGGFGGGADPMAFAHDAHRALLSDFLDAIETGRDPAVSGEEALTTQRLIEAILAKGAS
jgi:predicted dehydrogenase